MQGLRSGVSTGGSDPPAVCETSAADLALRRCAAMTLLSGRAHRAHQHRVRLAQRRMVGDDANGRDILGTT